PPCHRRAVRELWRAVVDIAPALAAVRDDVEKAVAEQPQAPVRRPAETRRRLDNLVEHRLQPSAARDGPEDAAADDLLLAQPLKLAGEIARAQRRRASRLVARIRSRSLNQSPDPGNAGSVPAASTIISSQRRHRVRP